MQFPFLGSWHYRSFRNIATADPINSLLFGEGDFCFDGVDFHKLGGSADFGTGYTMRLTGTATFGNPMTIRFRGVGTGIKNGDWVYDYTGFLVPRWPNGIDEVPAIVGSVIRAEPHDNGRSPAGFVASFIAVRKTSG